MPDQPDTNPIYLDYNATTPVLEKVAEAIDPHLHDEFGNPSSGHPHGERAATALEQARHQVAELLGATPSEIVFTSGGTESNNLALRGVAHTVDKPGHLVTSAIEHPAVEATCKHLETKGWTVDRIGVDSAGRLDLDALADAVGQETDIVSVMHANNETGVLQPIEQCAQIVDDTDALLHTDAAQSVGKVPVDVDELGVDLLTVAGHKLYAPKGIGALYVRDGTPLEPILYGAGHERGLRPGTEPVPTIVGLGAACEIADRTLEQAMTRVERLRDRLWQKLQEALPDITLNGHPTRRLPNTLNVRFPDLRGDRLLEATPEIAASTGSACHEGGQLQASPVITAMGIDPDQALGSVRLTLGRQTTPDEIDRTAEALIDAWRRMIGGGET